MTCRREPKTRHSGKSRGKALPCGLYPLIALLVLGPVWTRAEPATFPGKQWGQRNLYFEQSVNEAIESILMGSPYFEPVAAYNTNSELRHVSRSVGRLDIRFSDGTFSVCTAPIVATDKILTNHHCIPGEAGEIVAAELFMGYISEVPSPDERRYRVDIEPLVTSDLLDFSVLHGGEPRIRVGSAPSVGHGSGRE